VLAAYLRYLHPVDPLRGSTLLPQHADDLLLGEPASLYPSVPPQGRGLYSNLEEFSGLRSLQNDEWAVQRARYMSLETIAP
jgi:hypothetical protein